MQAKAILFSEMTPPTALEQRFNDWYDTEHIPIRMQAPAFVGAQRYTAADNAHNYLAVYDVESLAAFETHAYKKIKNESSDLTRTMLETVSGFTRYLARELDRASQPAISDPETSPILYAVWFDVPEQHKSEFDDWYRHDHVPTLMECPNWAMVRRFEVVEGSPSPANRLALHYLRDLSALDSPARAKARESPWRANLASQPWFKGRYQVFNALGGRFKSASWITAFPPPL